MRLLSRVRRAPDYCYFRARLALSHFYAPWAPVVTIDGIKVRVDSKFGHDATVALRLGFYELPELRLVASHLQPSDVVLELGTGLGVVASYCARRIGAERVYTFEANPRLEAHIRRTFTLNRVQPHLEMCLVSEHEGERDFYVSENHWASTAVAREEQVFERIRVHSHAFNEVVERLKPTFLIVDIEGGERDLCRYANFRAINKLLIEVHEPLIGADGVQGVCTSLRRAGFTMIESGENRVLLFEKTDARDSE